MLITVSAFDWRAEAKRASMLLDQHDRAVDGEDDMLLYAASEPCNGQPEQPS